MDKKTLIFAIFPLLAACGGKEVTLTVTNDSEVRATQIASVDVRPVLEKLGSGYLYVTDASGSEVPSQITCDSLLIFPVDIAAGTSDAYKVFAADSQHVYDSTVWGRLYPERRDDVAWENERVGFRIYGPATQAAGERAYGYDIFFKHPSDSLIVPVLYRDETDPAVWARVDSLRKIDPTLADAYIDSFSYHIDHGLGMDCYAVGQTLGNGCAAFVENDSLLFAWCYDKARVLDNGPLRFSVELEFAPRAIGADSAVVEHRIVSLDRGSYLNRQLTWFDGLTAGHTVAAGMPVRQGGESMQDEGCGYIAVLDRTQGPDNGNALLGVIMPGAVPADSLIMGHSLLQKAYEPGDTLTHYWGFVWDRCNPDNFAILDDWTNYLKDADARLAKPLKVTIK